MTPVHINERRIIPVQPDTGRGRGIRRCDYVAGIDMTPAKISSPRQLVRWYTYEALQISKSLGRLARLELHFKVIATPICKMTSVNQKKIQLVHWMPPLPINSWIVMSCINIVASLTLQKWVLRSSDD